MTATATLEIPAIDKLTAEQKRDLLTTLVKDELARQPGPLVIVLYDNGKELCHIRPKHTPPAVTTLPKVPDGYWEELVKYAENPGQVFTEEEILALEASGNASWLGPISNELPLELAPRFS